MIWFVSKRFKQYIAHNILAVQKWKSTSFYKKQVRSNKTVYLAFKLDEKSPEQDSGSVIFSFQTYNTIRPPETDVSS